MNGWELACLATMAVALVLMALAQVVLALVAARAGRQAAGALLEVRRELQPIVDKLHKMTDDAAKVTTIALVQAERIDQIVGSTSERIDEMLTIVQDAIIRPVQQGAAVFAGIRAALSVFRSGLERPRRRTRSREDEDALFIG